MESLERFGREILPEFKERDLVASAEKAKRLEPILDEVMARRVWDTPVMPEGYSMKAIPKAMIDAARSEPGEQFLDQLADKTAAGEDIGLANL